MSDQALLRIVLLVAGLAWLAWIWYSGTRPQAQGERKGKRPAPSTGSERREPVLGEVAPPVRQAGGDDPAFDAELERLGDAIAREREPEPEATRHLPGARGSEKVDRIVSLHVAARDGGAIAGPELVVAAEKAGLEFGDMGIFHRLGDGRAGPGPVFSVANMVKPGSFDMSAIQELRTPGVTFFMTLPGPLPALDAWDMMLPAAQRLAELLDAQVLDDRHNALGRQTIQHLRDELRAYDRKREKNVIKRSW
jgi:cell division protein ZipA